MQLNDNMSMRVDHVNDNMSMRVDVVNYVETCSLDTWAGQACLGQLSLTWCLLVEFTPLSVSSTAGLLVIPTGSL